MARWRWSDSVQDKKGNGLAGASARVTNATTGALATAYADRTGATTVTNPLTSDDLGRIGAWFEEGDYNYSITRDNFATVTGSFQAISGLGANNTVAVLAEAPLNVQLPEYGATGDSVTDDRAAIQAAMDTGASEVFLPPGEYKIGDGTSLTLRAGQRVFGSGRDETFITCKNAYAFVSPTAGAVAHVKLEDLWVSHRSGSVSGGAVKALGSSGTPYHSGWHLNRCYFQGQTTNADPVLYLDGWLGSYIDLCEIVTGQVGVRISADGFTSNASTMRDCRFQGFTSRAVYIFGGVHRIQGGIIESNTGRGIYIDASTGTQITGVWFEDNTLESIYAVDPGRSFISHNSFHQAAGSAAHVYLTNSGGGGAPASYANQIVHNDFQGASGSTYAVRIGAGVTSTKVLFNHQLGGGTANYDLEDLGSGTQKFGNSINGGDIEANRVGGPFEAAYRPFYDTQKPTITFRRRASQTEPLISTLNESDVALPWLLNSDGIQELSEVADPSAPAANKGKLYVKDNGSGKTQLCIRFNTGAVQVIATEP